MNWKQLYTSATEEERLYILLHMLQTIEARQNKIIFTGNHIIRNRRRNAVQPFHFIGEKRGRYTISRVASIFTIWVAIFATAFTSILIAIHAPAHFATQILFFPITAIIFVFLFKPKRQQLIAKS